MATGGVIGENPPEAWHPTASDGVFDAENVRADSEIAVSYEIGPYDPCPCGSGSKFKFCCASRGGNGKYPLGTVIHYGPDDKTCTKIVAGVFVTETAEPILERFVGTNVYGNPKIAEQIKAFFAKHLVKKAVITDGILGCPHEEGEDFPNGEDCPFCPFWRGKQGSARKS